MQFNFIIGFKYERGNSEAIFLDHCIYVARSVLSLGAETKEHAPNPKGIRVVPVIPTPEPNQVKTRIQFPKADGLVSSQPIKGQIKLEGYPLGTDTISPRERDL